MAPKQKQFQHLGWGRSCNGALGLLDNEEERELRPQPVVQAAPAPGLLCEEAVLNLCCGANFTLLLTIHGYIWSCGANEHGQLGYSSVGKTCAKPRRMLAGCSITKLACGSSHAAAISVASDMYVWGLNSSGQLGLGHKRPLNPMSAQMVPHLKRRGEPKPNDAKPSASTSGIDGLKASRKSSAVAMDSCVVGWQEVACGGFHTIGAFLAEPGARLIIASWGQGEAGCLGQGDTEDRESPTEIASSTELDIVQIACGLRHTVLLTRDQSVYTFGFTEDGRLGLPFLKRGEQL